MTLDELYWDYYRKRKKAEPFCSGWFKGSSMEELALGVTNKRGTQQEMLVEDACVAAKVYTIARDQGMEAAMVWKLANG